MSENQQLIKPRNIKDLVNQEGVKQRLKDIMGPRGGQFAAALVQITNQSYMLQKCTPDSILGSALMAAALDLSVDPNLGEAHLVPYKDRCTLQIGYVGLAQLAQRSGQYKNLGWCVVHEGELVTWDELSGELEIDKAKKKSEKIIGYAAKFRLINGFERGEFWTEEEVEQHAKRYSQSYRAALDDPKKRDTSPWFRDRERMSLKTVLKSLLKTWGPKSIQMQKALKVDEAAVIDVDSEQVEYVDNPPPSDEPSKPVFDTPPAAVEQPKEARLTARAKKTLVEQPLVSPENIQLAAIRKKIEEAKVSEDNIIQFLHDIGFVVGNIERLDQLDLPTLTMIHDQFTDFIEKMRAA